MTENVLSFQRIKLIFHSQDQTKLWRLQCRCRIVSVLGVLTFEIVIPNTHKKTPFCERHTNSKFMNDNGKGRIR